MNRRPVRALSALLIAMMPAFLFAWASDKPERIWILPFTQMQPDPADEYLQDALPDSPGMTEAALQRDRLAV